MVQNINNLVSICIPTYNGETFIYQALESINKQTYKNIEVIISDDNSKDNTLQLINEYKNECSFPIHILNNKINGIGANWNNCMKHATGDYIKFLFQDDVLESDCIEKMVSVFESFQNVGLVASKRSFIVEKESQSKFTDSWLDKYSDLQKSIDDKKDDYLVINKSLFKRKDFYKSPLNKIGEPTAVLFKKDLIAQIGFFDTQLKQCLDYEYWYRILAIKDIIIINEKLIKFRIHKNQATNINRKGYVNEEITNYERILYKNFFWLLNGDLKFKLFIKFNPFVETYRKLKQTIRN